MGLSFWHIALVVILFLLLFGRGRVPQLMGDLAAGIKSFKRELADDAADDSAHREHDAGAPRSHR